MIFHPGKKFTFHFRGLLLTNSTTLNRLLHCSLSMVIFRGSFYFRGLCFAFWGQIARSPLCIFPPDSIQEIMWMCLPRFQDFPLHNPCCAGFKESFYTMYGIQTICQLWFWSCIISIHHTCTAHPRKNRTLKAKTKECCKQVLGCMTIIIL